MMSKSTSVCLVLASCFMLVPFSYTQDQLLVENFEASYEIDITLMDIKNIIIKENLA